MYRNVGALRMFRARVALVILQEIFLVNKKFPLDPKEKNPGHGRFHSHGSTFAHTRHHPRLSLEAAMEHGAAIKRTWRLKGETGVMPRVCERELWAAPICGTDWGSNVL